MPVISGRKMQKLIILTLRTLNTSNYSGVGGYELRHTFFRQTKTEQKAFEIEITVSFKNFFLVFLSYYPCSGSAFIQEAYKMLIIFVCSLAMSFSALFWC